MNAADCDTRLAQRLLARLRDETEYLEVPLMLFFVLFITILANGFIT